MTFFKKNITLIVKVFLIWLLFQFLLHTFITFRLWFDRWWMKLVRVRKELLVVSLWIFLLFYLRKTKNLKLLWQDKTIKNLQILLWVSIFFVLILTLSFHNQSLATFILAFKYDFFGFVIFFIFVHIGSLFDQEAKQKLLDFYVSVMKRSLIFALVWRVLILYKPWILEVFFGYDRDLHESVVWAAPAATYRTNIWYWYLRNQFLFERPITFGFWLTAFRPLFYIRVLKNKNLTKVWGWRVVYILNVILTFSRAARGSWFVITWILIFITYHKHWKKLLFWWIIFTWIFGFLMFYVLRSRLVIREYSNTWHIKMTLRGINMFLDKPLLGNGATTAWPWSYQLWNKELEFNPENQFLQILDEFGIIGWAWWFVLYWFLIFTAYKPLVFIIKNSSSKHKKAKKITLLTAWTIIAFAVGMIWLSISGLVLHSFIDRMIVYPMMALYWLLWQNEIKNS